MPKDAKVTLSLIVGATLKGSVGRTLKRVQQGTDRIRESHSRAARAAAEHGRAIGRLAKKYGTLAGRALKAKTDMSGGQILGRGAALVGSTLALSKPIKDAIRFESVMADVAKTTSLSGTGLKAMGDSILALSTRIPMTAEGLGKIMAEAGQSGIARNELLRFAEDAAKMGVAFDMTAEEAGKAMTGLRNIFKLGQDDVVGLGDAYNHLSNNMAATARDMLNIANRAGSTAKLYGLTGQELGAVGAAFLSLKTPPEIAARATNSLLMKLRNAEKGGKAFKAAFDELGLSADDFKDRIEEDAAGSLVTFLEAVKKSENPLGVLTDIVGEGFADDTAKLVDGLDELKRAFGFLKDKKVSGSMLREYQARAATTANNLTLLGNKLTRVGVTLGSVFLPPLNRAVDKLGQFTDWFAKIAKENPTLIKRLGAVAAGFLGIQTAMLGIAGARLMLRGPAKMLGGLLGGKKGKVTGGLEGALGAAGVQKVYVVNAHEMGGLGNSLDLPEGSSGKNRKRRGRRAGKGRLGRFGRGLKRLGGTVVKKPVQGIATLGRNVVQKGAGKLGGAALKGVGKGIGKSALKKIPLLGALVGGLFAIERAVKGDWIGAMGEAASGLASTLPGLGTFVSGAIDAGLVARDISQTDQGEPGPEKSEPAGTSRGERYDELARTYGSRIPPTNQTLNYSPTINAGPGASRADLAGLLAQDRDRFKREVAKAAREVDERYAALAFY